MTTVFVTGAGTEIGKTYVTCLLLRALAERPGVRALKPVATGFDPGRVAESDAARLLDALGLAAEPAAVDAVTPWRFGDPLSPDMAAARERRAIDFAELVAFCRTRADGAPLTVIEGIGGVMVPLDATHTVRDWIAALDAKVLLVGGSYLGALSHTLSAAAALEARGVAPRAVVVSESAGSTVDLDATVETLERFLGPTPVFALRRGSDGAAPEWLSALDV